MNIEKATGFVRRAFIRLYGQLYGAQAVAQGEGFLILRKADGDHTAVLFDPSTELLASFGQAPLSKGVFGAYAWYLNARTGRSVIRTYQFSVGGVAYSVNSFFIFAREELTRLSRRMKRQKGYPRRLLQELTLFGGVVHELRHERQAREETSPIHWKRWRGTLRISGCYPPFNGRAGVLELSHRKLVRSYDWYRKYPALHRFMVATEEDAHALQFQLMADLPHLWQHNRPLAMRRAMDALRH